MMDLTNYEDWIEDYVCEELLLLIPILYVLGMILKRLEIVKDNFIPAILTAVSVAMSCLYVLGSEGFSAEGVFSGIIQGLICVAVTVYSNQLYKQSTK